MRHGTTPGNERREYVGWLDHPLSPAGREQAREVGVCPHIKRVYVTPLHRTHETAAICFPNAEWIQVEGLQEMDFGEFSGRTADEMAEDAAYRAWVDDMCLDPCPGGESRDQATERICSALTALLHRCESAGEQRVILVAHGGTIMSAFSEFSADHPERDYYAWLPGNCGGYRTVVGFDAQGTPIFDQCIRFDELAFLADES